MASLDFKLKSDVITEKELIWHDDEKWIVRHVIHTPDGDLVQTQVSPRDNPSTMTEKMVKNFKEDFKKIRHLYSGVVSYDASEYWRQKEAMGEMGMICVYIAPPGFQNFVVLFNGNLEALTYAYQDYPDLFEELVELYEKHELQRLDMASGCGCRVDPDRRKRFDHDAVASFVSQAYPADPKEDHQDVAGKLACCAGYILAAKKGTWWKPAPTKPTWIMSIRWKSPPWAIVTWQRSKQKFGHKLALMGNLTYHPGYAAWECE